MRSSGTFSWPEKAALKLVAKVCWCSSGGATTTQSTRMPGTTTCLAGSAPAAARRSTWAMTKPLLALAAMAIARLSRISASRSMLILPSGSAVVPRMIATLTGIVS